MQLAREMFNLSRQKDYIVKPCKHHTSGSASGQSTTYIYSNRGSFNTEERENCRRVFMINFLNSSFRCSQYAFSVRPFRDDKHVCYCHVDISLNPCLIFAVQCLRFAILGMQNPSFVHLVECPFENNPRQLNVFGRLEMKIFQQCAVRKLNCS